MRKLLLIAIVCCPILGLQAQFTYPATSTPNVFTNTNQFTIGIESGPITFAQLLQLNPTTTNFIYVSDATFGSSPCSGFGTGSFAFYIDGAWDCSFGGGGGGGGGTTYTGVSPIVVNNISNQISAPTVIQGAPTATQTVTQPAGTSLNTNILDNVRWVPSAATPTTTGGAVWQQTIASALTGGVLSTVTLVPCPVGIFGTDTTSFVYISSAPAEIVQLSGGGTCVPGAASGTIVFTPVSNHSGGYLIGTASAGIQETFIDASANGPGSPGPLVHIIFPPSNPASATPYVVRARVTLPAFGYADIDASGAMIDCEALWDTCFYAPSSSANMVIHGLRAFTKTTMSGAPITQTSCSANVSTITTTYNPPVGGWVDIQWTDSAHYWGIYQVATTSSTNWTFVDNNCTHAGSPGGGTIATATTPGGNAAEHAFLEDNGFSITLRDVNYDFSTFAGHNVLNSFIVIDADQDFLWENGDMSGGTYCGPDYCGQAVYAPGASAGTPIGVLSHVNMTLNCLGNGVKWLAGQGLVMTNESVIQGFSQYGVASGALRGSSGPTMLDGLYEEVGGCYNPFMIAAGFPTATLSAVSAAGVEQFNSPLYITKTAAGHSPSLQGVEPDFSNAAGGPTLYEYWLIINDGANSSVPLRFGHAAPASTTPYQIGWPRYASQSGSTVTYTVLRTNGVGAQIIAPFGTAVNSLLSTPIAQCSGSEIYVCTMNDSTTTTLQSYTVATTAGLTPTLFNWPGTAVLGGGALFYSDSGLPLGASAAYVTTLAGQPEVFSLNQDQATPGVFNISPAVNFGAGGSTIGVSLGGFMIPNGSSPSQPLADQRKGRLNFLGFQSTLYPSHVITISDSNPFKTIADAAHRPVWDTNDCYFGFDVPSTGATSANAQLSIGCAKSISQYVGNDGDNVSYGERLTATQKIFQVPITALSSLTVTGSANGLAFPFSLSGTQVSNVLGSATGWTTNGGSGAACNISGGIASLGVGSDGKVFCSYTSPTFANAQYVLAQLTALGSLQGGVGVRMSNSAETGYFFLCLAGGSSVIYRYNSGTAIAITSGGPPCVIGDYLLLEVIGSNLSAFDLTQGFSLTGSDSNIASGYPGLFGAPFTGVTFTNFRAGNLTYSATAPTATPQPATLTSCAAVGTAANPSVAACASAGAGSFSCNVAASGGTCVVNNTLVTAASTIVISPNAADGTLLGVTCNTTADVPTAPRLAAKSPGVSFTINLGTFNTNPECFGYTVTN